MGVMACIGSDKLTKRRIAATKVFSANLVTEELLPMADYLGNKEGFDGDKIVAAETIRGAVLNVPVLVKSPVAYELQVDKSISLEDGEVLLCKIRNVLADETLCDDTKSVGELIKAVKPVQTTCSTYFSWSGDALGGWGELMKKPI